MTKSTKGWWKLAALGAAMCFAHAVGAQEVVRHLPKQPGPLALAVEVPASATTVYLSGQVPEKLEGGGYGNTEQQTVSVLKRIQALLATMNLTMKDVVKMQVFLVGDPAKNNVMDFGGFMNGYYQFFDKNGPNLPARSVLQAARLVDPGWMVEIEVIAVKPAGAK